MTESCWFNRFAITGIPCPKEGSWRGTENATTQAMFWCDEHKHENDVLVGPVSQ